MPLGRSYIPIDVGGNSRRVGAVQACCAVAAEAANRVAGARSLPGHHSRGARVLANSPKADRGVAAVVIPVRMPPWSGDLRHDLCRGGQALPDRRRFR